MTRGDHQESLSIRRTAWKGIRKHFDSISTIAIVTIALRAAAFLPLLLCVDFGGKLPTWMGLIAGAAIYIAGAVPMRFWSREKMRRMFYSRHLNHRQQKVYEKWLKTGLLRYARGLVWGLPFLAGLVYFTVFYSILDVQTFLMPLRSLAILVGHEPDTSTGFLVAMGLIAFFGLIFAYGWWRDLPVEYLPARSLGPVKTLHWSRRIRKNHKKELRRNTFVNFLLCLPAFIGLGAVLVPYVLSHVDFSLSGEMVLNQLLRLRRTPPSPRELLMLAAVVLLLYLPFCIFRKTRNAALMGRLIKANSHSSHSSSSSGKKREYSLPEMPPKKVDFHPSMTGGQKMGEIQSSVISEERELAEDAARLSQEAEENDHAAG
jgi:hypothetical protein